MDRNEVILELEVVNKQYSSCFFFLFYCRLFRQFFLYALVSQMASGLFRVVAATGRSMVVANTYGSFVQLILIVLGGFVISRSMYSLTTHVLRNPNSLIT